VTEEGNWEGHTILSRVAGDEQLAADHGLSPDEVAVRLAAARQSLLEARNRRPQPGRDEKVLAAWNGLMIAALADASVALHEPRYGAIARRAAELVLGQLADEDLRLSRSFKDGRSRGAGVLEDYANLADGLLALYQAELDESDFIAARRLADHILARFADPAGGFFDTADDHEQLVSRPKGVQDNAVPSGGAMSSHVLLRIAALTGEGRYRDAAERALAQVAPASPRYPTAFAHWLGAMQLALGRINEVAIVGPLDDTDTQALVAAVRREYRPLTVLAAGDGESAVPLLRDRPMIDGRATAYVCHGFSCRQPVTDSPALEAQLSSEV
jgi:uncharacterized protein YyaL (SSP411 family)